MKLVQTNGEKRRRRKRANGSREAGHSQRERDHIHGEREERNWPFLGPPVGHWDDVRKIPAGGQEWKEQESVLVLRRTVRTLIPVVVVPCPLGQWMRGFHD
jgi:hypothetical protein